MNFHEVELQERLSGSKPRPYSLKFNESFMPNPTGNGGQKRKAGTQGGSAQKKRKASAPKFLQAIKMPATMGAITRPVGSGITSRRGLVLPHCEPIGTISLTAAGVLSTQSFALIPISFPYLGNIAANFGKWRWIALKLYYVPSCPTSTAGECALATYVDWNDNASGATFVQTATMKNGISFPPWGGGHESGPDSVGFTIDCTEFDKPRYPYVSTTTFGAMSNSDKTQYSPINLLIASQGSTPAVSVAGRIWAKYIVQLLDPIPSGLNG